LIAIRIRVLPFFKFFYYQHRRAGFSFPSRVPAGLETPRTTTVPSAAFLIGAGSFKTKDTLHPYNTVRRSLHRPPSLDLQSRYCFIGVADSSTPTIIDTDTVDPQPYGIGGVSIHT
jgi:hypothetical protein